MRFRSSLVPVLSLSLAAGCASAPHVTLHAPAPGASAAERVQAYDDLRPTGQLDTLLVQRQSGQVVSRAPDFLMLGDGERVHHAEDLVPVVPANSPTARAGRRAGELRREANPWIIAGATIAAVGLATSLISMATTPNPGDPDFDSGSFDTHLTVDALGLVVSVVGFGGMTLAMMHYGGLANEERTAAFMTYDRDLQRGLDVCADGMKIVACGPPAAPAAPSAADAPLDPAIGTVLAPLAHERPDVAPQAQVAP